MVVSPTGTRLGSSGGCECSGGSVRMPRYAPNKDAAGGEAAVSILWNTDSDFPDSVVTVFGAVPFLELPWLRPIGSPLS